MNRQSQQGSSAKRDIEVRPYHDSDHNEGVQKSTLTDSKTKAKDSTNVSDTKSASSRGQVRNSTEQSSKISNNKDTSDSRDHNFNGLQSTKQDAEIFRSQQTTNQGNHTSNSSP